MDEVQNSPTWTMVVPCSILVIPSFFTVRGCFFVRPAGTGSHDCLRLVAAHKSG